MKNRIASLFAMAAALPVLAACADHREMRTELYEENTYLRKDFLTRANPGQRPREGQAEDRGWLMGMTITAVSVPTAVTDIFPGLQSEVKYVRFAMTKDTLQLQDAIVPGPYPADGNVPDAVEATDLAPRVLQEWSGTHVDLQLRKNLDGEVTNFTEENRERPWEDRQFVKVDLEDGRFNDLSRLSWYDDWWTSPAMTLVSKALVPGSFRYVDTVRQESNTPGDEVVDWQRGDYFEWTVRLSYKVEPWYGSLLVFRAGIDTQTVDVKYSLWRRPDAPEGKEYVTRPIGEKDPYRRQFGVWDYVVQNYQDSESGFTGARSLLSRYNPRLPMDFYLVDVPKEFRDVYDSVAAETNKVFEQAGIETRIAFHDPDEGGIVRRIGDLRYSFVSWHNNNFTDIPWLGYGPSWMDPRTGEIINSVLNFNNWQGLHWYTQVVRDYLETVSDAFDDEKSGPCTPGEIRPVVAEQVKSGVESTSLMAKMTTYMGEAPEDWVVPHDEAWQDYYHMLLPDLRYFYPPYQTFVYSGREAGLKELQAGNARLMEGERLFWDIASRLDSEESPTGFSDFTSPGAIEAGAEFIRQAKESARAHATWMANRRVAAGVHGIELMNPEMLLESIADISQRCKEDGTWQTFEEWEDDIRWRIAHQTSVHELGHNIGLYHNFYASADRRNYQPCTGCKNQTHGNSSSVMDYVHHFGEVSADLGWYPYDRAALIYAYRYDSQEAVDQEADAAIIRAVHPDWHDPLLDPADEPGGPSGKKHPERAFLYANDYHEPLSPLVELFDMGSTPTEMVKNHILYYDWMYKFRNFRSYRQYWETWTYPDSAFNSTFWERRFLELWALDWDADGLENNLRLLGVEGDRFFFDNLRDEFAKEIGQANRMIVNFYRAILTQSNGERSYATTYDSFFGDVTRIGIIYDKFYAMLSFLGLWPADWYNWDDYAYLAFYEGDRGDHRMYSDSLAAVLEMLGGSYDVYPWFLPLAVEVFAMDTHDINFGDPSMKEWIGFRAFDRAEDMAEYFGFDPRDQALSAADDGHQVFHDGQGGQWAYLFLDDRNQHLCASADQSPASYKLLWDYNESVNINKYESASTYDIKYFLDYYRYFD